MDLISESLAGAAFVLGLFSVLTLIVFATAGARLMAQLPADYFINDQRRREHHYLDRFPAAVRPLLHLLRNLVGWVLVLIGLALLLLPGQGLLTILAGLVLMDFPGKYACERWLVRRPQVRDAINWLRRRRGAPPLKLDQPESTGDSGENG